MNLFDELTPKQLVLLKERNRAIDFIDSVHPENKDLLNELMKYVDKKNIAINVAGRAQREKNY